MRHFHIAEMARYIFCDQGVKDACKAAGLTGILSRRSASSVDSILKKG
jgi:hypothetical protein